MMCHHLQCPKALHLRLHLRFHHLLRIYLLTLNVPKDVQVMGPVTRQQVSASVQRDGLLQIVLERLSLAMLTAQVTVIAR